MQSHSPESYFILPVKKQPAMRPPRAPFVKSALMVVLMLIMVIVALSLGTYWDGLSSGDAYSLNGQ